jgi:hypothetical protein
MNTDDVAEPSVDATMTSPSQCTVRFFQPQPERVRGDSGRGDLRDGVS